MSAAATAGVVCELLRAYVNDSADIANDAASEVSQSPDPSHRAIAVLDGFDLLVERARRLAAEIRLLEPSALAGGDALVGDLAVGAEEAVNELRSEREAFVDVGPITDADMTGRVGQFFNALEKAMSVVEPQPERYGPDELRSAFDAEPSCTFVVQ